MGRERRRSEGGRGWRWDVWSLDDSGHGEDAGFEDRSVEGFVGEEEEGDGELRWRWRLRGRGLRSSLLLSSLLLAAAAARTLSIVVVVVQGKKAWCHVTQLICDQTRFLYLFL